MLSTTPTRRLRLTDSPCQHTRRWHVHQQRHCPGSKASSFLQKTSVAAKEAVSLPQGTGSSAQNGNLPSRACPETSQGPWVEREKAAGEARETGGLAPHTGLLGPSKWFAVSQ